MKVEIEDMDVSTICDSVVSSSCPNFNENLVLREFPVQSSLVEGCRLPVHMRGTSDWRTLY